MSQRNSTVRAGAKPGKRAGYGCEDVDPRGFVSLMDLYENNYMRLRRLAPLLTTMSVSTVSKVAGCLDLHLSILERTKFTTTLRLTYLYEEDGSTEPDLTLRVYHDLHQLEVLTGHLKHGRQHYDHIPDKTMKIKWKLNRFVYKWLGYCLYQGHTFEKPRPNSALPTISIIKPYKNQV